MQTWFKDHWLRLLAIVMLLGALAPFPYVYYQFLNWVVMGAAIMTAFHAFKQRNDLLLWIFVFAAVVFNPFAPFYFRQDIWRVVDVVTALVFVTSFFFLWRKSK